MKYRLPASGNSNKYCRLQTAEASTSWGHRGGFLVNGRLNLENQLAYLDNYEEVFQGMKIHILAKLIKW